MLIYSQLLQFSQKHNQYIPSICTLVQTLSIYCQRFNLAKNTVNILLAVAVQSNTVNILLAFEVKPKIVSIYCQHLKFNPIYCQYIASICSLAHNIVNILLAFAVQPKYCKYIVSVCSFVQILSILSYILFCSNICGKYICNWSFWFFSGYILREQA